MSDRPGPDLSPIRPRWAPVVGAVLAVIVVASVVVLFAFVRPNAATELGLADYVLVVFVAGILLGILWRQSTVSATPSPEGLAVRNLMGTTRLEWAQIVSVRFSPDRAGPSSTSPTATSSPSWRSRARTASAPATPLSDSRAWSRTTGRRPTPSRGRR